MGKIRHENAGGLQISMEDIIFYFELHQPFRLRPLRMQDKIQPEDVFWEEQNMELFRRISENTYIPATRTFMESGIHSTFSLSGTFIEQALKYSPKTIDVIEDYVKSGLCELMGETYFHSLRLRAPHHQGLSFRLLFPLHSPQEWHVLVAPL